MTTSNSIPSTIVEIHLPASPSVAIELEPRQSAPAWSRSQWHTPCSSTVPAPPQVAVSENWQLVPVCPKSHRQPPVLFTSPTLPQLVALLYWQCGPRWPASHLHTPSLLIVPTPLQILPPPAEAPLPFKSVLLA